MTRRPELTLVLLKLGEVAKPLTEQDGKWHRITITLDAKHPAPQEDGFFLVDNIEVKSDDLVTHSHKT